MTAQIINFLTAPPRPKKVRCYIQVGQSNTEGDTFGVAPVSPYITPNPNAYICGYRQSDVDFPEFSVMDYTTGNFMGVEHGAEASLAYNHGDEEVYFIKVAKGGTSLALNWNEGSTLRNKLIERITYAKQYFIENNIEVEWVWYWNQWEASSLSVTESNNYSTDYPSFVNNVTSTTQIVLKHHIIAKVNVNSLYYANNPANCETIIIAQYTSTNATVINIDHVPLGADQGHYTSDSQIEIGNIIYNLTN